MAVSEETNLLWYIFQEGHGWKSLIAREQQEWERVVKSNLPDVAPIVNSLRKEQFSIQNVSFRRADMSDFDTIMAFGDLYEGRDYFMAFYEEFLSDADNFCVVALDKDRVVGFVMTGLIDGGLTEVGRCARVHPNYIGLGIFQALHDEIDRHTMLYRSSVVYQTFVVKSKKDKIPMTNPYRPGFKPVVIRQTRAVRFLQDGQYPDQMGNLQPQLIDVGVRRLKYADIKLVFDTKDVARELFPSRRLFHFMIAYRLLYANIRDFMCKRSCVLVSLKPIDKTYDSSSKENGSNGISNIGGYSDELDLESVHRISMMTNYLSHPTRNKEFCVFMDIHTRCASGSSRMYEDLRAHLEYMKKDMQRRFPGRDGVVHVLYNKPLCTSQVLSCYRDAGIGELVPNGEKHVVLWERPKIRKWSKL